MTIKAVPILLTVACSLALAGCGTFGNVGGGSKKKQTKLPGERIPVLTFQRQLEADPAIAQIRVALPRPYRNASWAQPGGVPTHAMYHLSLADELSKAWETDIGRGSEDYTQLVGEPVVAGGTVFTLDTKGRARAIDAATGRVEWEVEFEHEREKSGVAFGGGAAHGEGKLFVNTGYGYIAALDPNSGRELWRQDFGIPLRAGPTVSGGRVFTQTHDNQLFALNANTGERIWEQAALPENAGILGSASPAVLGDTVVAAFSSGELTAFRVENGRVAWQDTLSRTARLTPLATLADIDGQPVIDRGRVYANSHSGRMVAIDIRTGERVWEINLGGINTPWVAGDFIYVTTADNEVACVSSRDGRIRWVTQLQRYKNQKKLRDNIAWSGPVLAGDRLILLSSHGYLVTLSPYNGRVLSGTRIGKGSFVTPVVAAETLFVMSDAGELIAYR